MDKQSQHFVDDVRKWEEKKNTIFSFFFTQCVWEEEDKQALKRRKKCLYHHRLKTHRKPRVPGSNWHANTPSKKKNK